MFPEDDGEPRLEIIEHPKSRGFRFRYTCEGPSHGGIPGASSDKNKKTFPAVKIVNYQGYARIVVQLVTNEENPRLHPHSLVGKQCQNGICTVQCGPKDMTATFPNLGIQHVTKKNVASILEERYIAAEMQLSSINDGFPQEVQRNIKDEDRKRIAAKAQSEAKSIDLSVVRLMFIAYLPDSQGAFTIMLKPIISEAIFDSKAPNAATLKICRMDCNAGSASGGDEVYLLCDKVQKDDIQVRFLEEDQQGNAVWESYGNFCPTDVHRQFAIVFRTPAYRDQNIRQPVNVNVQLRRKSDGEVSEARTFTYLPIKDDFEMIERKRRKIVPSFLDHMDGNSSQGYSFAASASGNSIHGTYHFEGSSGSSSENIKKTNLKVAAVTRRNPQRCPLDPISIRQHFKKAESPNHITITPQLLLGTRIPLSAIRHCRLDNTLLNSTNSPSPNLQGSSNNVIVNLVRQPHGNYLIQSSRTPVSRSSSGHCHLNDTRNTRGVDNLQALFNNLNSNSLQTQPNASNQNVLQNESPQINSTNFQQNSVGNDVAQSFPSSTVAANPQSNDGMPSTMPLVPSDESLSEIFDIEFDGIKKSKSSEYEHDFASVLYEHNEQVPQKVQSRRTASPSTEDIKGDCFTLSQSIGNLSIHKSSILCSASDDFSNKDMATNRGGSYETNLSQSPAICSELPSFQYKVNEANKMAEAIHAYSITGDVRMLLSLSRHLTSTRNENGDTVLHSAVIFEQSEVLNALLDVIGNLENKDEILNGVNKRHETALHIATLSDNVNATTELLCAGANPLVPDQNGNHSLHVACRHGNADILSRLLDSKQVNEENVDVKNYKGFGCFHLAIQAKKNHKQCLNLLASYCNADLPDDRSGKSSLHMAVENGDLASVQCLLSECDAHVNAATFDGVTPLHLAVASNYTAIAFLLLTFGADPEFSSGSETSKPVDLIKTDEMRKVFSDNILPSKMEIEQWINQYINNEDLLVDSALRKKFCRLINSGSSTSNWSALADQLQLSQIKYILKVAVNPTETLLKTYALRHGTLDGMRSALMKIKRYDAVQILNRASLIRLNELRCNLPDNNISNDLISPIPV